MNSKIIANGILRAIGVVFGIALLLFFFYKIQSVIVYITIAVVISLIGRPMVIFFQQKLKLKNTLAVIITMLILISFFIGLILLFIPLIVEQAHNLSLLDIEKLKRTIENLYAQIISFFEINNLNIEQSFKKSSLLSKIDYSIIPNFLNALISGFGSFSVGLFSVLFISFFFLKDSKLFENGLLTFVPESKESRLTNSYNSIKDLLSRYFVGLIFQILIIFIIYTIGLLIVGIENAIVIAFLCALLNLIPYVGPLVGGFLMVMLTMTSNLSQDLSTIIFTKIVWVLLVFIIGQLIDNFFSQPYIFSKSVKSHPLEIFLLILIAGILFGVVGLIVAIPVYTAIKVVLKEFLSDNQIVKKLTKNL